jgi:hypothetical protein
MTTTRPISKVSPSKYTNPAVFNRIAEEMLFLANICSLKIPDIGLTSQNSFGIIILYYTR